MSYEKSFDYVIGNEGKFVNDPHDRGGATNYGITQSTLSKWRRKPVSVRDVQLLSLTEAQDIYKAFYWDAMNLDEVKDERVQTLLFDQCVNRGVPRVARDVQRILNVAVDGEMGPKTVAAINAQDPLKLMKKLINVVQDAYVQIIVNDLSQVKFLAGWINRSQKYFDLI